MKSIAVAVGAALLFISTLSPAAEPGGVRRIKYDRLLEIAGDADPWSLISKAYTRNEIVLLLFSSHRDECAKYFHNQADLAKVAAGSRASDAKNVAIIDIDTTRLGDQPSLAKWYKKFSDDLPDYNREAFGASPDPLLVLMDTSVEGFPRVAPQRFVDKDFESWKKMMDASEKYILATLRQYGHRLGKLDQLKATMGDPTGSPEYERITKGLAKVQGSIVSCSDRNIAYWKGREKFWREVGPVIEDARKKLERK